MVKVIAPLFSLGASGTIGDSVTFATWRGVDYARMRVIPGYSNTTGQQLIRMLLTEASQDWSTDTVTASQKALWDAFAAGRAFSGYNAWVKAYLDANYIPGSPPTVESPRVVPDAPGT